jgi:hypothetical protein
LDTNQFDLLTKVVGVIVLLVVIVFILIWSGVIKCNSISPFVCDAYDMIMGSPRVLIAHGDSGMGDPEKLKEYLQAPQYVGASAIDIQHVDRLSAGNLKQYKLVIVEQAKSLSADQLIMFMDYVNKNGGRLVWIGDSGTQTAEGDFNGQLVDVNTQKNLASNPWIRVKETDKAYQIVSFDEFLGLRYLDNYCNQVKCTDALFTVGRLEAEATGKHPLIFGTSPQLTFKINKERDFSIVRQIANSGSSNVVLNLNHMGVGTGKTITISKNLPLITTSTLGLGERVAYYAYPPEWFLQDNNYFYYLKNMYYGMLGRE